MRIAFTFVPPLLLVLTACGGAVETPPSVETSTSTQSLPPRSALGLWVSPPSSASSFLPLDVCADGTVSFQFPSDPRGVRERCAAIGGSHEPQGARVRVVVGAAQLEATVGDDDALVLAGPAGDRVYYRTSPAVDVAGTYSLRTIVSEAGADRGPVTLERRLRFEGGRFTFDSALAREGTDDRWTTVEQGSYVVASPGDVVLAPDAQASHVEHAVVFGARGEHLHVGRIGYMTRIAEE